MKRRTHDQRRLTPRQVEIVTFIRDYRRTRTYSPTLQEIADHFGIVKVSVFEHVEHLVGKGLLRRLKNKARSLELTHLVRLPDDPVVCHQCGATIRMTQ